MFEFIGYYGIGVIGALILIQLLRVIIEIVEKPLDLEPPQPIPQFKSRKKIL